VNRTHVPDYITTERQPRDFFFRYMMKASPA